MRKYKNSWGVHVQSFVLSMLFCVVALLPQDARAQLKVGNLFKEMPDSLMPLLTKNNRLDMIDFMDAKMKAIVTNLLDGESQMTVLADDSLSIQMSPSLRVDLYLVPTREEYDSCKQVLCMVSTYKLPSQGGEEQCIKYYSVCWRSLANPDVLVVRKPYSNVLQQDEKLGKLPLIH